MTFFGGLSQQLDDDEPAGPYGGIMGGQPGQPNAPGAPAPAPKPAPSNTAPVGGVPGQSGPYGGINPGGQQRRAGAPVPIPAPRPTGGGRGYSVDAGNDVWVDGVKYGHSGGWSGLSNLGFAVGKSAQQAYGDVPAMSWRDIAGMMGITDWKGPKDPRKEDVQNAYWGNVSPGANGDTTRLELAKRLRESAATDPRVQERLRSLGLNEYGYDAQGRGGHGYDWAANGGLPGGAGGGGRGGGGGGQLGFEDEIEQLLRAGMRGDDGPFSDEVRNNMRASAKEDAAGQLSATNKLANLAAVRSGNLYSGSTAEALAENARSSDAALNRGFRDIDVQGAQANFDAKLKSRDQALNLLQQRKEEAMANARNAIERERIRNDYDVAIQNVAVQREKIAADKEAADKASRAEMASGRAWREHEMEKMNLQRQWDVEDYANRELPFLMGEYGE